MHTLSPVSPLAQDDLLLKEKGLRLLIPYHSYQFQHTPLSSPSLPMLLLVHMSRFPFTNRQSHLVYEGELTFVTSRDFKNLPEEDSDLSKYVLGYIAGNDLSPRNFQLPEASGSQFCCSKSFDGFAPIGHCLVSSTLIPDPQALRYVTRVNGDVRQTTGTDDMI